MKFKVVGKSLILTDCSHKITEGENSFDTVEIAVPHYHDDCELSTLSFRFSEISENGENSAVQILRHTKCDEKYIYLKGTITSDFSVITGKVIFMLTGVSGENIVAKFQSTPYTISDDISLVSLPNETTAGQLFNQTQLEVQKAIDAANRAEIASQTPAPAEIYPATNENLGGVLSGNDISVGNDGTVTVNSVNGKTLGKSVPADAVFTDTVYTLPKATTVTLGGVKVDGNTITASIDGTISAKEVQNLAVQIAHPNNYLIYDDVGKPSVMVAIPKFYLDEVIDGASHTVHPAFIINGVEQDAIYISKYLNIVEDNRAYSLPMKVPKTNVTFDQAWQYCKNKGKGWHLMTSAEWAAIALWCKKNGIMPKGNNNCGKEISEANLPQKAVAANRNVSGDIEKTLTGSGGYAWNHDGTAAGIADLNGNIWEWNAGLRLNEGEIQVLADNNAADCTNSVSADSTLWKTIMPDGSLVTPGTSGTLKYDWINNKCTVSTTLVGKSMEGHGNTFKDLVITDGITIPEIIKALAIYPADTEGYEKDFFYMINSGERLPLRGGYWFDGADAGVFRISLNYARTDFSIANGLRCAYYEPN